MAVHQDVIQKSSTVAAIILAAGEGKRMQSSLPKVLHDVAGKPMVMWVVEAVRAAGVGEISIVVGGEISRFNDFLNKHRDITVCLQEYRRGTGDAVAAAAACFAGAKSPHYASRRHLRGELLTAPFVLICAGDTPAIDSRLIGEFVNICRQRQASFGVLGMDVPDPTGYGRVVTGSNDQLVKIVEHRDATASEREIPLCNSGIIFAKVADLFDCLDAVTPANAQNEYYLTDIFEIAANRGLPTTVMRTDQWRCLGGINTPEQKAAVEDYMRSNNFRKG